MPPPPPASADGARALLVVGLVDQLAFVEGPVFQGFISCVIMLNILALWGETDYAFWPWWPAIDNVFLCAFLTELLLRLLHHGAFAFWRGGAEQQDGVAALDRYWNWLDTAIVLLGVIDLWAMPFILREEGGQSSGSATSLLRFLRLLRIARLVRVFRIVRKLAIFMEALGQMLSPLAMLMSLLFLFNGILAIIFTHIFGHGEGLDLESVAPEVREQVQLHFRDVQTSFLTLFQVATRDNWNSVVDPLAELDARWRLLFIGYIMTTWTGISILTALATNNTLTIISDRDEKERLEREKKQREFIEFLRQAFRDADEDGNDLLDKKEFEELVESEALTKLMGKLDVSIVKEDMTKTWDMLDVTKEGVLTIEEFVDGLSWLQEGLCTRHVATLRYGIQRFTKQVEHRMGRLEDRVARCRRQNEVLLSSLRKQEQVQRQQCLALYLWQQWAVRNDPHAFPPEVRAQALRPPPWLESGEDLAAALAHMPSHAHPGNATRSEAASSRAAVLPPQGSNGSGHDRTSASGIPQPAAPEGEAVDCLVAAHDKAL